MSNYNEVKDTKIAVAGVTIVSPSMPPDYSGIDPLTPEEKTLISLWFADGMPVGD